MKYSLLSIALLLVLAGAAYFRGGGEPADAIGSSPVTEVEYLPMPVTEPATPAPPVDGAEATLLAKVRAAFTDDHSPAQRIRAQSMLSKAWAAGVPHPLMIQEIGDQEAPPMYRSYLARWLRNEIKRDPSIVDANVADAIRKMVRETTDSFEARSAIARALIDVAPSDRMVAAITPLLFEARTDVEATGVVTTLSRTKNTLATDALKDFVQAHQDNPNKFPKALAAAVLPLSYRTDLPLTDLLSTLASHATDPALQGSLTKAIANHRSHE